MTADFKLFVNNFKSSLGIYQYKKYKLSKNQYVFDIENSLVVSILLRLDEGRNHIIVEEIFNAQKLNIDLKRQCAQYVKCWVSFFPFQGKLGEPETFKGESQYAYIKKRLPKLEIDRRYQQWKGYRVPFAGFELSDGRKKGYAIAKCQYIDGVTALRNIGKELINAYRDSKEREQKQIEYIYGESKYLFVLDKNMCEILQQRYFSECEIPKLKNGFEIFDMKGFWMLGFVRDREEIPYEVLEDLKRKIFKECVKICPFENEKSDCLANNQGQSDKKS